MDESIELCRLKRGEIAALEGLVARYYLKAVHLAYLITGEQSLAEDVAQEAFASLPRTILGFDLDRPFAPWFMKCVANAAIQAAQKQAKGISLDAQSDGFLQVESWAHDDRPSVEDDVEFSELKQKMWQLLQQLTPRQRAALVQRYYLGMSEKEMAQQQQVAPGTIKWLLNLARTRLRFLLRSEENKL